MTAPAHTLYSATLFLALAVLNLWSERRQRIPRMVRARAIHNIAHALPVWLRIPQARACLGFVAGLPTSGRAAILPASGFFEHAGAELPADVAWSDDLVVEFLPTVTRTL
jgi:hypothetical protein